MLLHHEDDPEGAERHLSRAVGLEPGDRDAWFQLGRARLARGDAAGALEFLARALDLDPNYGPAWYQRGVALEQQGDRTGADAAWREALLIDPTYDQGVEGNLELLGFTPEVYSPYYELVDAALVDAVHTRSMLLIPWTINDVGTMRALLALGVDGLITDYPDRALPLLEK